MKILFDTNVIISSFITKGVSYDVVRYAKKRHILYVSNFIIKEVKDKLKSKFKFTDKEIKQVSSFLNTYFMNVGDVKVIEKVCRDKDDNNILFAAVKEKVNVIITGDEDLLVLKKYQSIDIIKPADFWRYEFEKIF